ncbi:MULTISPECIES: FtsX-like permease family protein [unclassified Janthinobacterium]|uniref:FtsX-like permease family protein n=1 Tax=unclassified Janthinobacterium TaxID=2610881 RepID=UPI0025B0A84C|nr:MULTISPECIES: FtsX-like permease family protein [unclassified Janthinobacterium]MDN2715186.1 ABC transporter permease [Janthinobacterium sp. SUN120]MDO8037427.1 ABC transporter permease [Janthinobacterium sp. SUN137]
MTFQDFRVGLRILVKDPAYSLVAILGLGIGLAACLLLLGFARYCWQYNAHVPDADNVYIVKQRNNLDLGEPWVDQAPLLLREAARTAPGVSNVSGYVNWFPFTVQVDGQLRKLRSLTVLPGFAEMMGLQVLKGDLNEALSRPDSFAITEETAIRLFGSTDVLGRTVTLSTVHEQGGSARIAAILRNPPANTTIPFQALNGLNLSLVPQMMRTEALTGEQGWLGNLLVRVRAGAPLAAVTAAVQQAADSAPSVQNVPPEAKERLAGRKIMDIRLAPLREAYFDREVATNAFSLQVERGSATVVTGLVVIAILILVLAAINYVNLATIRVIRRQREICMRKVLGASAGRLALQFVAESLLVTMLATAIGLLLACLALPVFAQLVNRDLGSVLSLENLLAALAIGLVVGLLTVIYPAWIAFGVRPAQALAGRPDTESRRSKRLRQALSVLQLAVAMGLASVAMAIAWQTRFAIDASPGFDPAPLLVFDLPEGHMVRTSDKARGLMAELSQQPGVAGIAFSTDPVGRAKNQWSTEIKREGGEAATIDIKSVSANFFEQYGVKAAAGRLFDSKIDQEDDAVPIVINAIAARKLGFASPEQALGQTLLLRGLDHGVSSLIAKRVVGIAPEILFYSLREAPGATAYELWAANATLTVRASGSVADAERAVRTTWAKYFPNSILEARSAKDIYAENYAEDARLARLLAVATVIAMTIAAFGAYVLAADAVQRRTQEIALRKLYGARRSDIGKLVAKEVGTIIALSAVVALPLAALLIANYLRTYAVQAPLAYWTLVFALAVTLVTAAVAVARHAWIAMRLKPAVALRT